MPITSNIPCQLPKTQELPKAVAKVSKVEASSTAFSWGEPPHKKGGLRSIPFCAGRGFWAWCLPILQARKLPDLHKTNDLALILRAGSICFCTKWHGS